MYARVCVCEMELLGPIPMYSVWRRPGVHWGVDSHGFASSLRQLCGLDSYLALVLICFNQNQIRYHCYKEKIGGCTSSAFAHLHASLATSVDMVCARVRVSVCVCVCERVREREKEREREREREEREGKREKEREGEKQSAMLYLDFGAFVSNNT